jgi:hypothetical protein
VLGLVGIHVPKIAVSGTEHMMLGAFSVGAVSAVGMLQLINSERDPDKSRQQTLEKNTVAKFIVPYWGIKYRVVVSARQPM